MERRLRAGVIQLFHDRRLAGGVVSLEDAAVQHLRARRARAGDAVRLLDGCGRVATGVLGSVARHQVTIHVDDVSEQPPPRPLEVVVPVADRDRMLLAAEKCTELQVTAWRPAYFARSRSVSPRGEGDRFREKLRARMRSALEQSGAAWLPVVYEEAEFLDVLDAVPADSSRFLLDASGPPLAAAARNVPAAVAVGPEGGMESAEIGAAVARGWRPASIGTATLRFETALIAGVAVLQAGATQARS